MRAWGEITRNEPESGERRRAAARGLLRACGLCSADEVRAIVEREEHLLTVEAMHKGMGAGP